MLILGHIILFEHSTYYSLGMHRDKLENYYLSSEPFSFFHVVSVCGGECYVSSNFLVVVWLSLWLSLRLSCDNYQYMPHRRYLLSVHFKTVIAQYFAREKLFFVSKYTWSQDLYHFEWISFSVLIQIKLSKNISQIKFRL